MKNKILVIGGAGFLGSHVSDSLTENGYQVTIMDRTESKWLKDSQEFILGDILDDKLLLNATKDCLAVYNFAGIADLNEALLKPKETARVNVLGNVNILEACRINDVNRYVYASTVYVHSRVGGFYRCSKQSSELYVEEYQNSFGLDYTILRYGSLYGPRSNSSNGLWRIVKDIIDSGEVIYEGNIESKREYIHVKDAAHASVEILKEEYSNQHIVLTGTESIKVIELLQMLSEIMGIEKEIKFKNQLYQGHYVRTPYSYQTKLGRKFIPNLHVDLGQGLLQLIDEVKSSEAQ